MRARVAKVAGLTSRHGREAARRKRTRARARVPADRMIAQHRPAAACSRVAAITRSTSARSVRSPSPDTRVTRHSPPARPQCCRGDHADRSRECSASPAVRRGPAADRRRRRRRRGDPAGRGRRERAGVRAYAAEEPLRRVPAGVRGAGASRPQRHRGQLVPVRRQRLHRRGRVGARLPRYVYERSRHTRTQTLTGQGPEVTKKKKVVFSKLRNPEL